MNKQLIEQAASSYADSIPQFDDRKRYCREDFIAGVEWMAGYIDRYIEEKLWKVDAAKPSQDLSKNIS